MIAIRHNERNYSFASKEATQSFCTKELKFASNILYTTDAEFEALGFQTVIDAVCTENQHLGDLEYKDGKFYRYAVDNPPAQFNPEKCEKEVYGIFDDLRQYELRDVYSIISPKIYSQNFVKLKLAVQHLFNIGRVTQQEYNDFVQVMLNNGVDLDNY